MKNVSYEFQKKVSEGALLRPRAVVTLADGTALALTDDNFRVEGNAIVEGAGESRFPLGAAVGKTLSIVIDNKEGEFSQYDFYYARIQLYTDLTLDNGTTESINEGIFTVTMPETPGTSIAIDAVDDMYKADEEYKSSLSYPTSLLTVFLEALSKSNMTGVATFNNSDYMVQQEPTGLTFRQLYGLIAQIAGGNAICDGYGQVNIKTYNAAAFEEAGIIDGDFFGTTVDDTINGGNFTDRFADSVDGGIFSGASGTSIHNLFNFTTIRKGTDEVEITGISTTVSTDNGDETLLEGAEGYTLGVTNALITGNEADALRRIGNAIIGIKVRPFSGEHIAYPMAEFMDPCYIWDTDLNMHQSFITDIIFNYLGKTSFSNSTEDPLRNKSTYFSNASEAYRKAQEGTEQQRAAWEKAAEELAERLEAAGGLYTTIETQTDGSEIIYMHNKPALAESLIVWKLTSDALGVSTDGGETWNAGLTVDGDLLARILSAVGINADWINVGSVKEEYIDANYRQSISSQFIVNTNAITAEVARATAAEGALSGRITVNADAITAEVTRATAAEGTLGSRITQNATSITAEVTRATSAENALSGRITVNANAITAEVTRATAAEGTLRSSITVNAEAIALKVEKGDVRSQFSIESGSISISSGTITFTSNTLVINSSNFTLSASGVITAISGSIGGFTIASNALYTGRTSHTDTALGVYMDFFGISVADGGSTWAQIANGRLIAGAGGSTSATGYVSFNASFGGSYGAILAGQGGVALLGTTIGTGGWYSPGSSPSVYDGKGGTLTNVCTDLYIGVIKNSSGVVTDVQSTWTKRSVTFLNGLMVTSL